MFSLIRRVSVPRPSYNVGFNSLARRHLITEANSKKEGDISSVFASLSGSVPEALPQRFADIKRSLIAGHEDAVSKSWTRLLSSLKEGAAEIHAAGPSIIPELDFTDISSVSGDGQARVAQFRKDLRKRGAAVIRGVVSERQALQWKEQLKTYLKQNPHTKAFPKDNPQVWELYWSPSQVQARANENLLRSQSFIMSCWHSSNPDAIVDTETPVVYADRLRMRQPGDATFALGPHVDGGSVERWEPDGYGKGGVYDKVWQGKWEEYDPFESSGRLDAVMNLYESAGTCSMFRMFQGWLSMSTTGPGEGTLKVNPLLKEATAYYLLRPFFSAKNSDSKSSSFIDKDNWILDEELTTILHGAVPSLGQEFTTSWHPHLELEKSMIHVPKVFPGDYVVWHCDTIHAVDKTHAGKSDSSVMYIPACPLTAANVKYLERQKKAFESGAPGPDFPGGIGEGNHVGRPVKKDVELAGGENALTAMGY